MAKKSATPGKRAAKQPRERIERARNEAIGQLRALGISPDTHNGKPRHEADQPRDEGDHAQASERQDLSFLTRERLADRINRLTAALQRLDEGTYGTCELCEQAIETSRLAALPEVTTCLECQRRRERERVA